MSETPNPETEAHGMRARGGPVEVQVHGARIRYSPETEAHAAGPGRGPEAEAHALLVRTVDPIAEGQALLRLQFPPDAEEQTIEVRYRPSGNPGEPPEIELHFARWSDRRLKRRIRAI